MAGGYVPSHSQNKIPHDRPSEFLMKVCFLLVWGIDKYPFKSSLVTKMIFILNLEVNCYCILPAICWIGPQHILLLKQKMFSWKNLETKHYNKNLPWPKNTSSWSSQRALRSGSGLSFFTSAMTYFAKAVGSASQLKIIIIMLILFINIKFSTIFNGGNTRLTIGYNRKPCSYLHIPQFWKWFVRQGWN